MWTRVTYDLIDAARDEDLGTGDLTSSLLPGGDEEVVARVVPRQAGVICGLALAPAICDAFSKRLWKTVEFAPAPAENRNTRDGDPAAPGRPVGTLRGARAAVLSTERTLLNFLGRMSGVATLTGRYVDAARAVNPSVQILDTRKTLPGWRELDKYAVQAGGGTNHRRGLYDAILIKDNHLAGIPVGQLAPQLSAWLAAPAVQQASFVEVEVDSLAQFEEVCRASEVNVVLLDNFAAEAMRAAVARRDALAPSRAARGAPPLLLEASGGVRLEQVAEIAATGVDRISVGALTHSAVALDVGLDF